jgi:superfamily II DNA or RNA helicase
VNPDQEFATNRPDATPPERVADAVVEVLREAREQLAELPRISISTAYFNPGGFNLLAPELERTGPVRLLLGAEPEAYVQRNALRRKADRPSRRNDPRLRDALDAHARALAEDRDLLGFTIEADATAQRLVQWLSTHPDVQVRRYEKGFLHGKAFIVQRDGGQPEGVLAGSSNFTYAGLARNNELNLGHDSGHIIGKVVDWFDEQWEMAQPFDLAGIYSGRWDAHSPLTVFLRMLWEKYGTEFPAGQEDKSSLGLTRFQTDGVWRAERILETRGGVIIADEVGLGKTYLAGELIFKATFERRQKVLVVAPATLRDTTWRPFLESKNIPAKVVSFDELALGNSGIDPNDYAMVVVDEAHGLRNANALKSEAMRALLGGGAPKDLVMLTATPVNNSLLDLYNLISYFAPSDAAFADIGIPSLGKYFGAAMAIDPDELSPQQLFSVLDAVAVRRTRRFVKQHYAGDAVDFNGHSTVITFPTPKVQRVDYDLEKSLPGFLDKLAAALGATETSEDDLETTGVALEEPGTVLSMARYVPSRFLAGSSVESYQRQNAGLLRSAMLKRFESSGEAFARTLGTMIASHQHFLSALEAGYVLSGDALKEWVAADTDDIESVIDGVDDDFKQHAAGYDVEKLSSAVTSDIKLLEELRAEVRGITAEDDPKILALADQLAHIAEQAKLRGTGTQDTRNRRKVLIFTYFADTAAYVAEALEKLTANDPRLADYAGRVIRVSGSDSGSKSHAIAHFAPTTAGKIGDEDLFDILVATDVLAEGVNLQQAGHIVNYDLPWNPMRLVQRHGRIDRIGSPHKSITLRCFFPSVGLDKMLKLEELLQRKLKQAAAAVGISAVLPDVEAVERVITENRDTIERLRAEDAMLFNDDGALSVSGEEYRYRLRAAMEHQETAGDVLGLPWGSGALLHRDRAQPAIVFCAKIADHEEPWFRMVPLDASLAVLLHADGAPFVSDDTAACLNAADPRQQLDGAEMSPEMRLAAYSAWEAARQHVFDSWMYQTDPANLSPQIDKALRDAANLVASHGGHLGEAQDTLIKKLRGQYAERIRREIRGVLRGNHLTDAQKVDRLKLAVETLGLTVPLAPTPLELIDIDDVHLVCWTLVLPTAFGKDSNDAS